VALPAGEPVADLCLQGGGEGTSFNMQDAARGGTAIMPVLY
jgi:hypothetical protein